MIFHIRVPFKKFLNIKAKGFTLVELLVTISIVSVISSTIYAPFNTARKKGRDAKRVSEIKSIQTALTLFSDDNGGCYPIDKNFANDLTAPNMLSSNSYKYISKTLFDKLDMNPKTHITQINLVSSDNTIVNGVLVDKLSIIQPAVPPNVNTPYVYRGVGDIDCAGKMPSGTDLSPYTSNNGIYYVSPAVFPNYNNVYFSKYQLFTNLEASGTALSNDTDSDMSSIMLTSVPSTKGLDLSGQVLFEKCDDKFKAYNQGWNCIYDLSN